MGTEGERNVFKSQNELTKDSPPGLSEEIKKNLKLSPMKPSEPHPCLSDSNTPIN